MALPNFSKGAHSNPIALELVIHLRKKNAPCIFMVDEAQRAEHLIVAQKAAGSRPAIHPNGRLKLNGEVVQFGQNSRL